MKTDDQLAQIEKIAQNARTTWFGLLALLVFVGVTLMGHKDADFFAYGAATQLPLVGIEVPPTAFFIAAPILTAAVYCYLHVYLLGLWEALGRITQDAQTGAAPLSDRVFPILFTVAALRYRNRRRRDGSFRTRALGVWTTLIAVIMGWGFGWAVLALVWWRSMALHDEGLTLLIGACLWIALMFGAHGLWAAHRYLSDPKYEHPSGFSLREFSLVSALLLLVSAIGWLRTEGGFEEYVENPWIDSEVIAHIIPLYPANLAEAELTAKPADWLDFEDWKKEYTLKFRKRYDLGPDPESWLESRKLELSEEFIERWDALAQSLEKVSIRNADLRNAIMKETFLVGADLRAARLSNATLNGTRLESANLERADLSGATLVGARLESASLASARMADANFTFAVLDHAVLINAMLTGANLSQASMQEADLRGAVLELADLSEAWMLRADLSHAQMTGVHAVETVLQFADLDNAVITDAVLFESQLQGASLYNADLSNTDLGGTLLIGSNLRSVNMKGAAVRNTRFNGSDIFLATLSTDKCNELSLVGSTLHTANLWCQPGTLVQEQLEYTTGNIWTILPNGTHTWSCIQPRDQLPNDISSTLQQVIDWHPDVGNKVRVSKANMNQLTYCRSGQKPVATGSTHFEKRFWKDFDGKR